MHCCRHLTLKLLKSGEINPRAISLPSAIVRCNLLLELSSLLNDHFSMKIKAGLGYATYQKCSWDGRGEERGSCICFTHPEATSANTEFQRNFLLVSASFQVEIGGAWGVLLVLFIVYLKVL